MHAKVLWFIGPEGELLVTGSANPSKAAFLSDSDWRNTEAVVGFLARYRGRGGGIMVPAGTMRDTSTQRFASTVTANSSRVFDCSGVGM